MNRHNLREEVAELVDPQTVKALAPIKAAKGCHWRRSRLPKVPASFPQFEPQDLVRLQCVREILAITLTPTLTRALTLTRAVDALIKGLDHAPTGLANA